MLGRLGDWGPWLLIGFALAISRGPGLFGCCARARPLTRLALGLVLGGAMGNAIDRLRFGAVVDFLDFHALGYHWPAFNVSDSSIVSAPGCWFWRACARAVSTADEVRGQTR